MSGADPGESGLLARCMANQGKLDEALVCCEQAISRHRMHPELHYIRAAILQEQGQEDLAAEALKGQKDGQILVEAAYDDVRGWLRLEIRDNGPGLSPEERSRLFEPYFSRKKGGTGLGLTIVKSIVSDHHGYVRTKPNQPRGTVLVVELPVAPGARATAARG